jgi:hypothetical protein
MISMKLEMTMSEAHAVRSELLKAIRSHQAAMHKVSPTTAGDNAYRRHALAVDELTPVVEAVRDAITHQQELNADALRYGPLGATR